jgi:hypothetical protein
VSSASASANSGADAAGPTAAAGVLNIGTAANTSGAAVAAATSNTTNASVGLLAVSDIAGNKVAGTTQTATLLSSGSLVVYTKVVNNAGADASNVAVITVTGGSISSALGTSTPVFNSALSAVGETNNGADGYLTVTVKPNSGATSMTVNLYNASGTGVSTLVGTPTGGTLTGSINVSIAATTTAGVVSVTKSAIYYNAGNQTAVTAETTTAGIGTSDYATTQYGSILPKDAYGTLLGAGHLVQASASNGAVVALTASGTGMKTAPASAGTISTSFTTTALDATPAAQGVGFAVAAGTLAATGGSTIVTVSVDGVAIGTKSFTFTGKVAKAVLSNWGNGLVGSTSASNWVGFKFYDAAGNQITWATTTTGGTAAYPASFTKDTNGFKASGAGLGTITWPVAATAVAKAQGGYFVYTCTQDVTDAVQIDYANPDGTVVVSNAEPMSCSGTANSYTAKLDKAKYAPGEIATLSVTFKDVNGALAADNATGITDGTTASTPSITGGNLTPVSAATDTDATTNGVATYKFIVGSTDGAYQLIASFPTVNALNSAQSAQTVSYTVASGSTSLNDVLKGIVSLIASINKQIAALAKLVSKK